MSQPHQSIACFFISKKKIRRGCRKYKKSETGIPRTLCCQEDTLTNLLANVSWTVVKFPWQINLVWLPQNWWQSFQHTGIFRSVVCIRPFSNGTFYFNNWIKYEPQINNVLKKCFLFETCLRSMPYSLYQHSAILQSIPVYW